MSAQMVKPGGWLIDGSLLYRLNEYGSNCDEINVTQTNGSRDPMFREFAAKALLKRITAPQEPAAAGWMTIETAPKDGARVLLYFPLFGSKDHQEFGRWDAQPYNKKPNPFWSGDMERNYGVCWYRKYPPSHWMPIPTAPRVAP